MPKHLEKGKPKPTLHDVVQNEALKGLFTIVGNYGCTHTLQRDQQCVHTSPLRVESSKTTPWAGAYVCIGFDCVQWGGSPSAGGAEQPEP